MDKDMAEMKIALAVMSDRVAALTKTVEAQGKYIEDLVTLSNKGKGAAWILIGMGGIVGALAAKLLPIIPLLSK